MTGFDYAASQLAGVWGMAWNRDGWRAMLDRSVDGVFKSFWAMVFAAPFSLLGYFLLRQAASRLPGLPDAPLLHAPLAFGLGVEIIGYLVNWVAALVALVMIARALRAGERISEIIIGFNWLHVFIAVIQIAPLAAMGLGGGSGFAGGLAIASTAVIVALFWGYVRRAFGAPVFQSAGLVIFLTLLGLLTNVAVEGAANLFLQPPS